MKIFQLIDWLTKLFKLNNKAKVILLILLPLPIFSQNNAAFWLGKRASAAPTNLLLDDYPGAAAAYSVRKLDKDYTGFAMEIRRASDNATQNIGFVGEDLDEAAINFFCSGTTCYVKTWYDQSGNGHNATQAITTSQPIIYQSGSINLDNSKPALKFLGNSIHFNLPNLAMPTGKFYLACLVNATSNTSAKTIIARAYNFGSFYNLIEANNTSFPNYYRRVIGNANTSQETLFRLTTNVTNNQFLFIDNYDQVNLSIAINNNAFSSVSSAFSLIYNANDAAAIGSFKSTSGALAAVFTGNMQEIILYHDQKTTNDLNIRNNINTYYSIY